MDTPLLYNDGVQNMLESFFKEYPAEKEKLQQRNGNENISDEEFRAKYPQRQAGVPPPYIS